MKKSLGKNLCNSRKLKKVVVIKGSSKTNKQTSSFQKVNVFKNSEKVPYSKSSFYNQLIKYSVSSITLTNDKYRRKNSHSITVCSCFRTHLTLFISGVCRPAHPSFVNWWFLKNEPIILCLTYSSLTAWLVPLVVILGHSLSLFVIRCLSLSLVVIRCTTRCHSLYHSLSLDVPLVCLFINDLYDEIILMKKIIFLCNVSQTLA